MKAVKSYTSTLHVHVRYYVYQPKVVLRIKGIIQLHHGLGEHAELYDHFASYLLGQGFVVVVSDFVGHGQSLIDFEQGYFGNKMGVYHIVEDMKHLLDIVREAYPDTPYFMMGVDIGGAFVQKFASQYGDFIEGMLLLGTLGKRRRHLLQDGYLSLGKVLYGPMHKANYVYRQLNRKWDKHFGDTRYDKNWFSSDEEERQKYIQDSMSDFVYTIQGYKDIFRLVREVNSDECVYKIPEYLSIYIGVGQDDPLARGAKRLVEKYKKRGIRDLTFDVFEKRRHALLFEKNKDEVYKHILQWLNDRTYV